MADNKIDEIDFWGTAGAVKKDNKKDKDNANKIDFMGGGKILPPIKIPSVGKIQSPGKMSPFQIGGNNQSGRAFSVFPSGVTQKRMEVFNPFKVTSSVNPFRIPTSNIKIKDIRWTQAQGNKKYDKINLNPFGDHDKDGVLNMFDCRPFDPRRQEDLPKDETPKKVSKIYRELTPEEFDSSPDKRENKQNKIKLAEERTRKAELSKAAKEFEYLKVKEKETGRTSRLEQQEKTKRARLLKQTQRYEKETESEKKSRERLEYKSHKEQGKQQAKARKAAQKLAEIESKQGPAKFGSWKYLEKSGETMGTKIEGFESRREGIDSKIGASKRVKKELPGMEKQYKDMPEGKEKKELGKKISEDRKKILTDTQIRRLGVEKDLFGTKLDRAKRGEERFEARLETKRKNALKLEKAGLGWVPGTVKTAKETLKRGLSRYTAAERASAAYGRQKILSVVSGALLNFGGLQEMQAQGEALDRRAQAKSDAIYDQQQKALYMAQEAQAKRAAGRPFGTFKYGMPIQEYKAMMRNKERSARIQEAMQEAEQVSAMQAKTDTAISSGITYGPQMTQPQQAFGSVVVGQSTMALSPYAALQSAPQYGAIPQISQSSYDTFRREEAVRSGFDPQKRYPRSMTTSQLRQIPNIYGDLNTNPNYARIPVLPTDPALIREDDLPRSYFADEQSAGIVAQQSEGQYQMDLIRGREPSLSGSIPMQYAARVKDLRAPTTKNMVLQTQNDGQRKMVPVIKANPWGVQIKNRINFSENNILEQDLKGNVASRDQIGGNIMNAPNVFHGNDFNPYNPQQTTLSWTSNKWSDTPSVTGLGTAYVAGQYMPTQRIGQMTQEQVYAAQQQMMARQMLAQQQAEAKQPSFYDRLANGQPLRPVSKSVPQKKKSFFDKMKAFAGIGGSGQQQAQTPTTQQSDEVAVNMTEEEFNNLPVVEQQRIIEEAQQQTMVPNYNSTSPDVEMANYQAEMQRKDDEQYREAAIIQNELTRMKQAAWDRDHEDTNVGQPKSISDYQSIKAQVMRNPTTDLSGKNENGFTQEEQSSANYVGSALSNPSNPRGISMGQGGTPY